MLIRSRRMAALAVMGLSLAGVLAAALVMPQHPWVAGTKKLVLSPFLWPGYLGDGGPAEALLLCYPMGLARTTDGDLLISDRGRARRGRIVWRIDPAGIAHAVAGTGMMGDAVAARAGALSFLQPEGLAPTPDGGLFVADSFNHVVLHIAPDGTVRRAAGTGQAGFSGDGGPAAEAMLNRPADIRLDRQGNLYIADVLNHRVRKIDPSGVIRTVAGTGIEGFSPDGTPAVQARLASPWGIAIDAADRLLIADSGNHRVRRVDHQGRLVTVAGNGRRGYRGDGGPAVEASLDSPQALDTHQGRIFIGDEHNNAIRMVAPDGTITTVMGTGEPGRAAIGAIARHAPVDDPENLLVLPSGELVFTDGNSGRVLRIGGDGRVHHVAGAGTIERCATRW